MHGMRMIIPMTTSMDHNPAAKFQLRSNDDYQVISDPATATSIPEMPQRFADAR
jgi:hypothetical protein